MQLQSFIRLSAAHETSTVGELLTTTALHLSDPRLQEKNPANALTLLNDAVKGPGNLDSGCLETLRHVA